MKNLIAASIISILAAAPVLAEPKGGWSNSGTDSTQGQSGKETTSTNEGTRTITYEGPNGQIKKGSYDTCNNCNLISVDLPGKNR